MKKIKLLLFAFVCLFGVGMINANALVWVGTCELSSKNNECSGTKGSATWDNENKELTLDNFTYGAIANVDDDALITIEDSGDVKIILKGDNKVFNPANYSISAKKANLTIESAEGQTATLNAMGANAVIKANNITINNVKLILGHYDMPQYDFVAGTNDNGLFANNVIINNSDVKINVKGTAIYANSRIKIENTNIDFTSTNKLFNIKPTITLLENNKLFASENADGSNAKVTNISSYVVDATSFKYAVTAVPTTITSEPDDNSTIALSQTEVIKGSTVEATIGAKEGYKVKSVLVNGDEKLAELKDGKLTLTVDENTTIKVISESTTTKEDTTDTTDTKDTTDTQDTTTTATTTATTNTTSNPNTGDNIVLYIAASIMALIGITYVSANIYRKKYNEL